MTEPENEETYCACCLVDIEGNPEKPKYCSKECYDLVAKLTRCAISGKKTKEWEKAHNEMIKKRESVGEVGDKIGIIEIFYALKGFEYDTK